MASIVRRYLFPPIALVVAPLLLQYLTLLAREEDKIEQQFSLWTLLGNPFGWMIVLLYLPFQAAFLMIPFDKFNGARTTFGMAPEYTNNAVGVYFTTSGPYIGFHAMWAFLSMYVYDNFPSIIAASNIVALLLASYLFYKGKYQPQSKEKVESSFVLHELCRGVELHPRLVDMFDVKQWAICRVGFLSWQILVIAFFYAFYQMHSFNWGLFVNALLQSYYIYTFLKRESSYLLSVDVADTRPGYYLLWYGLAFVPTMHSFSTYYFVSHAPNLGFLSNLVIFLLGSGCIYMKEKIELQKDLFKSSNGQCLIKGRKASYIEDDREVKEGCPKAKLLTSGYWGKTRHLNLVFDLLSALCWCLPGINLGIYPFLYCFYLTATLLYRMSVVEAKCARKYGPLWSRYCKLAKYKLIPYVY